MSEKVFGLEACGMQWRQSQCLSEVGGEEVLNGASPPPQNLHDPGFITSNPIPILINKDVLVDALFHIFHQFGLITPSLAGGRWVVAVGS